MKLSAVLLTTLVVSLGAASAKTTADFTFSTPGSDHHKKTLRRQRRTAQVESKLPAPQVATPPRDNLGWMEKEDEAFFDRMLGDAMSIPATPAPTPCPVIIDVDCVSVDGTQSCSNIDPPASGSGSDCIVEVEYSYTMTNVGNEVERIYSLEITRGGETTDITNTFPITDISPGESAIIIQNAEIDICQAGDSAFDTAAAFVTGPPCDVEVIIACASEEGDECRSLPQAPSPEDCLLDITYTYTVTNTGDVDANIVLFTRTRNGEFQNLMPLLPETYLPVADSTAVEETEEIDRCVQQSFATNTIVAQVPNADLLCEDVGYYP